MPKFIFIISSIIFLSFSSYAWSFTAYVLRVEDGNTIAVCENKNKTEPVMLLRLYGIDAPTRGQPFGNEARQYLMNMLPIGSKVTVDIMGDADKEGAKIAMVQAKNTSVNYQLLVEGYAWVNRSSCKAIFCRRWLIQEHRANQLQKGVWSINTGTPPWQWGR